MKSEPDGLGGRGTPGRNKRGETGDGREGRTLCLMSGTLGRPDEGIEDGALGSTGGKTVGIFWGGLGNTGKGEP